MSLLEHYNMRVDVDSEDDAGNSRQAYKTYKPFSWLVLNY